MPLLDGYLDQYQPSQVPNRHAALLRALGGTLNTPPAATGTDFTAAGEYGYPDVLARLRAKVEQAPGMEYGHMLPLRHDPEGTVVDWAGGLPGLLARGGIDLLAGPRTGGFYTPEGKFSGEAIDIAPIGAGMNIVAKAMRGAVPDPSTLGANVWHGGPNKWAPESGFPQGRPRLDKIGTGEGAAAYGWGFYGADNKGVAKTYKTPEGSYQRLSGHLSPKAEFAYDLMEQGRATTDVMQMMLRKYGDDLPFEDAMKAMDEAKSAMGDPGTLYRLDVPDADVAKFLDWDAPLSEQSESVKKVFALAAHKNPDDTFANIAYASAEKLTDAFEGMTGNDLYRQIVEKSGWSQKEASEYLKSIGIPGHKYLDQQSRNKTALEVNGVRVKGLDDIAAQYVQIWNGRVSRIRDEIKYDKGVRAADRETVIRKAQALVDSGAEIKKVHTGTHNYVIWNQDVLDRSRVLKRNGDVIKGK